MIDHISVAVSDLGKSAAFYDRLLAPLGMTRVADRENSVGYGKRYPEFWINARPGMSSVETNTGVHICLRARTTDIVDAFHAAALAHGGADDGAPGPRQGEMTEYYGAFVRDPDGNKVEVATFPPKD
jgi:catechol 2,3-dioxygenase-like lactoylglutathione lyase family enzyme